MNDPKYTIKDGRLWHRAGEYAVPEEEPVTLLRGKDPFTLVALAAYYAVQTDDAHKQSILERILVTAEYQRKYPQRTTVGCHLCGDE